MISFSNVGTPGSILIANNIFSGEGQPTNALDNGFGVPFTIENNIFKNFIVIPLPTPPGSKNFVLFFDGGSSTATSIISGNYFLNNTRNGMIISGSFTNPQTISGNNFNQQATGIILGSGGHTISNNLFTNQDKGRGIYSEGGNNTITSNKFTNNNYAIWILTGSGDQVHNNIFLGGDTGGKSIYHHPTTNTLDATCNWWNTTVSSLIPAKFAGKSGAIGLVNYLQYSTTPDALTCDGVGPVVVYDTDPLTTGVLQSTHLTIQAAIDKSTTTTGNFITVASGTYTESLNINKSITLRGAQQGIDPRPSVSSSRVIGSIGETKLVSARNQKAIIISANNVTIDGFEITQIGGTGAATTIETTNVNHSGISIINNIVTNTTTANAMRLVGGQDFLIQNNYLKDIPGEGIVMRNGNAFSPAPTNQKIKDNDIINQYGVSGGAIVTYGQTGMEISGNIIKAKYQGIAIGADGPAYYFMQDIEVHHNEIVMEMATTAGQDYGIIIGGLGDNINIHNNIISDLSSNTGSKYTLIKVSFDNLSSAVSNPQNLVINDNYLSRSVNENYITIGANITNEVNASCNWFESSDPVQVAARIGGTGAINYLPFLTVGTDDNVSDTGFTPVAGACAGCLSGNLVTNTNTSITYCSIQSAIDAATAGDVITASAGVYTENVTVSKSLTIRGANTGKNPNSVSRTAESRLLDGTMTISGANTVILDGFEVYQTDEATAITIAGESAVTLENTILNREGTVLGNAGTAVKILAGTGVKSISANMFTGSYNTNAASSRTWLLAIDVKGSTGNNITIINNVLEKSYKALNVDDMSAGIALLGNKFVTGNTWMSFGGSSPTVGLFTFGANDFGFSGGDFIDLINVDPSFRLDISAGSYNNQSFNSISLYNSFVIEAKIKHRLRNGRNGLVYLVPNTQYVSYNSIQDAINYAPSVGETINVRAGNYLTEQLLINKSLTLKGPNYNIPCGASRLASTEANIISNNSIAPITIAADNVVVNGLGIKGVKAFNAIDLGSSSNTMIAFNNIREVGTDNSASGSNVHAILYTLGTANTNDVMIVNNCIDNIGRTSLSGYSASAIGIIESTSSGVLDGLSIQNNTINNVKVSAAAWPAGKVAYGILTNVGGNSSYASNTGNVKNSNISFNTISGLSGHIATGIALEGNTEEAIVERNTVSNLTSTKTANRAGGGYDSNGLKFENNKYVSTVTVQNNSFDVGATGYAVANYVPTAIGGVATLNCNWFASSDYGILAGNYNSSIPSGKIFNKEGAGTMFIPYLTNDTIDPADAAYSCSSSFATPIDLQVTYDPVSENIMVNFELSNNSVAAYPIPGLDPATPADLNAIAAKYAVLKGAIGVGTSELVKAAAFDLGDDVITEYYYMNGTDEVYLQTAGSNDLIKSKYWEQYLVNSGTSVRYPKSSSSLFVIPAGQYATSTNPATLTVANGWLIPAYGKDLHVKITVVNNGNVSILSKSVFIDPLPLGPVDLYSDNLVTLVGSFPTIQAAIDAAEPTGYYVKVAEGTYPEVLNVNKAVAIVGPNIGVNPNTGTRLPEAIVTFPAGLTSYTEMVNITTDGAMIDGLTFDGNNLVTTEGTTGIIGYADNISLSNNIVSNFSYVSVWFSSYSPSYPSPSGNGFYRSNANIKNNYIHNADFFEYFTTTDLVYGIYMQGANGSVTGNVVEDTNGAIQIQPYNHPNTNNSTSIISNNSFQGYKQAMWFNYSENTNAKWSITDNTLVGIESPINNLVTEWVGLRVQTVTAVPSLLDISGNTVSLGTANPSGRSYFFKKWDNVLVGALNLDATFANNTMEPSAVITDGTNILNPVNTDVFFYSKIQNAIDDAASSGFVKTSKGVFPESLNISKSVTLQGANDLVSPNTGARVSESVIMPLNGTALTGNTNSIEVIVRGFTFDQQNSQGINDRFMDQVSKTGTKWTFENNIFQNGGSAGTGNWRITGNSGDLHFKLRDNLIQNNLLSNGISIWPNASFNLDVQDNVWENNGAYAMNLNRAKGIIKGNTFRETRSVNFSDPSYAWYDYQGGIVMSDPGFDLDVIDNEFLKVHSGIILYADVAGPIRILNNLFDGTYEYSIRASNAEAAVGSTLNDVVVSSNSFINYLGVKKNISNARSDNALLTTTCNWFGSAIIGDVQAQVSPNNVDTTLYLTDGTDSSLAIGFQPGIASCGTIEAYSGTSIISSLETGSATASKVDAYLNIVSNNLGVVITRVDGATSIAKPVEGMIIYDTADNKFKVNTTGTNAGWRAFLN